MCRKVIKVCLHEPQSLGDQIRDTKGKWEGETDDQSDVGGTLSNLNDKALQRTRFRGSSY
jgi:hypothetical protein